jgi:hypothetical protein
MNEVKSGAKQIYTIPVSRSIAVLLWKCNDQLGPNAKISHKEHFPRFVSRHIPPICFEFDVISKRRSRL